LKLALRWPGAHSRSPAQPWIHLPPPPQGTPGLTFGAPEKKMGWRMQPTCAVNFDRVFLPSDALIGSHGQGFKIAMSALDGGRINIAACSVGGAAFCLDTAYSYAQERSQFGQVRWVGGVGGGGGMGGWGARGGRVTHAGSGPSCVRQNACLTARRQRRAPPAPAPPPPQAIGAFQASQFKLADMATRLQASRLMVRHAAAALDAQVGGRGAGAGEVAWGFGGWVAGSLGVHGRPAGALTSAVPPPPAAPAPARPQPAPPPPNPHPPPTPPPTPQAPEATMAAAMAKRLATDECFAIALDAQQLLGGYGFLQDFPVERLVRDLRVHSILEGGYWELRGGVMGARGRGCPGGFSPPPPLSRALKCIPTAPSLAHPTPIPQAPTRSCASSSAGSWPRCCRPRTERPGRAPQPCSLVALGRPSLYHLAVVPLNCAARPCPSPACAPRAVRAAMCRARRLCHAAPPACFWTFCEAGAAPRTGPQRGRRLRCLWAGRRARRRRRRRRCPPRLIPLRVSSLQTSPPGARGRQKRGEIRARQALPINPTPRRGGATRNRDKRVDFIQQAAPGTAARGAPGQPAPGKPRAALRPPAGAHGGALGSAPQRRRSP
jgi:alkylation response protein AidB-like acyl-CoA dehydrogenase